MAKSNLQGINTSDGAIGIELNEQEELILKANNIVIACRQAISHHIWRSYRSTRCKQ